MKYCEAHQVVNAPHCPVCLIQERDQLGQYLKSTQTALLFAQKEAAELREENEQLSHDRTLALALLADIRAAAGDPEGKLMQGELVDRIQQLKSDREMYRAAEYKWETTMMEVIGEDGVGSVKAAIEKLKREHDQALESAGKVSEDYEKAMHRVSQLEAHVERLQKLIPLKCSRQFRHNDDNSPNVFKPEQGFVIAYDKSEVDELLAIMNTAIKSKPEATMSDAMRETFERLYIVPEDAEYNDRIDCYRHKTHPGVNHPFNEVYESFQDGWQSALEHAGRDWEPFTHCFTDVNGEAKELCSAPTKDDDPRDMRTITPLYKQPPAPVVPEMISEGANLVSVLEGEGGTKPDALRRFKAALAKATGERTGGGEDE